MSTAVPGTVVDPPPGDVVTDATNGIVCCDHNVKTSVYGNRLSPPSVVAAKCTPNKDLVSCDYGELLKRVHTRYFFLIRHLLYSLCAEYRGLSTVIIAMRVYKFNLFVIDP